MFNRCFFLDLAVSKLKYFHKIIVVVLFLACACSSVAQKHRPLKSKIEQISFYSETELFITCNSVLTIQADEIILKENILGDGTLRLANTPFVKVQALNKISVTTIKIENTTLSLESDIGINGELILEDAIVQLNDFNLHLKKPMLLNGQSFLLLNGMGKMLLNNELKYLELLSHNLPIVKTFNNGLSNYHAETSQVVTVLKKEVIVEKPFCFVNVNLNKNYPPPKVLAFSESL